MVRNSNQTDSCKRSSPGRENHAEVVLSKTYFQKRRGGTRCEREEGIGGGPTGKEEVNRGQTIGCWRPEASILEFLLAAPGRFGGVAYGAMA